MTETAARTPDELPNTATSADDTDSPATAQRIDLLQWHLDRYDRLRVSTSGRASVVLSASAILSAGNAVVLAQLLGGSVADRLAPWLLVLFTALTMVSAGLVVLSLLRAASVLVTPQSSRTMLGDDDVLPAALVFNGTDTVRRLNSFAEFQAALARQGTPEILQAAQVELWIGIQQHRQRYVRLRAAVRLLRYAAVAFLVILAIAMIGNLFLQF
ncbi:hypothetical protein [Plantactinospora endophytica]|uniref:Metal-dependent phosphohydrolase n=1 Tax=Plantactinospora endophytica TaxID=673535 RepID=A0ABQ4E6C9_9ACTN|nr:hypothetical protein [Plantactinospora endophytica]GIG90267.1 hypothetical protein Pen02_52030 [Plantactinospora endophytica]